MAKRILKAVGYALFFLVVVVVFMYWTFPMDKVRHFVERSALQRAKLDLRIAELELSGISGVVAEDLVLRLKAKADKAGEESAPSEGKDGEAKAEGAEEAEAEADAEAEKPKPRKKYHIIRVDRVEAHASLWDLIFGGGLDLTAEAEGLGGKAGDIHIAGGKSKTWKVDLGTLEDLDLALLTPMEDWLGFRVGGQLSGSVEMTLARTLWDSRVDADLEIEDALLKKPVVDVPGFGPIYLTDIDLGTLKLKLQLDRRDRIEGLGKGGRKDEGRVFHVEELAFEGGDIELQVEPHGTLILQKKQPLKQAHMSLTGSFRVDPTFFDKTIKTDSGTEKPNGMLRMVLKQDRKWKSAERNGVYGFRCRGKLAMKSCVPTRPTKSVRYSPDARRRRAEKAAQKAEEARKKKAAVEEESSTPRPTNPTHERTRAGSREPVSTPSTATTTPPRPRLPERVTTEEDEDDEALDEGDDEDDEELDDEGEDEGDEGDEEELDEDDEGDEGDEDEGDDEGDEESEDEGEDEGEEEE